MNTNTAPLAIGNISIEYAGIVSRSRIRLFDGRRSWELDVRLQFASHSSPRVASYCVGSPNWRRSDQQKYMANAQDFADWLLEVMDAELMLARTARPDKESGIICFINKFKSPERKKGAKDKGSTDFTENEAVMRIAA